MKAEETKEDSGYQYSARRIPVLNSKNCFEVVEKSVGGDAPKNFVKADIYGRENCSPIEWPSYIAKVGHKWYPGESVTEHLLTRVGQHMGFRMAKSYLVEIEGQLRFLSKYFLKDDQTLTHGIQIISRHINDESENFLNDVIATDKESDHVMFQDVVKAVSEAFPEDCNKILKSYVRMLAYDTLVGNHDRHYYNWGVITDVRSDIRPKFSPIYDSARGCFWNFSEDKILDYLENNSKLKKYARKSDPLVGFEGKAKLNHFALMKAIYEGYEEYRPILSNIYKPSRLQSLTPVINREFAHLLTVRRRNLIFRYLALRLEMYGEAVR